MDHTTVNENIEGEQRKWRSSVTKTLKAEVERVWKVGSDFLGIKKYAAFVDACDHVEGDANAVGCVRSIVMQNKGVKEKLVAIDPASYSYSYTMGENEMGLKGYMCTFKLQAVLEGTVVEWSFEADPSLELSEEEFIGMTSNLPGEFINGIEAAASADD